MAKARKRTHPLSIPRSSTPPPFERIRALEEEKVFYCSNDIILLARVRVLEEETEVMEKETRQVHRKGRDDLIIHPYNTKFVGNECEAFHCP